MGLGPLVLVRSGGGGDAVAQGAAVLGACLEVGQVRVAVAVAAIVTAALVSLGISEPLAVTAVVVSLGIMGSASLVRRLAIAVVASSLGLGLGLSNGSISEASP